MSRLIIALSLPLVLIGSLSAQAVRPEPLRTRLTALAHDTMMGRDPGTPGNFKAAEYVAAEFRRFGLTPAGDSGTFFQTVTLGRSALDPSSELKVGSETLKLGPTFCLSGSPREPGSWHPRRRSTAVC